MKINKIFLGTAAILMLAGCNDEWNEDKLDGFQEGSNMTDIKNVEYTLTDDDYKTIANNKTNKALAEAEGLSDQLRNLTKNKYFDDEITTAKFLPAYLTSAYPTADDMSAVKVTYNKFVGEPAYLDAFKEGTTYDLTNEDYVSVWEAKKVEASYLTPKTLSKLPGILKNARPDAKAGDVVIANYSYSQTEPSITIGGDEKVEVPGPWKFLTIPTMPTGNSWTWVKSGEIDLSAYAGKKIQLGFTYMSDGTDQATGTYDVTNINVSAGGATLFEEGFTGGLGEFTTEGELPEGLSFIWAGKDFKGKYYARASAFANGKRYAVNSTLVTPVIEVKGAAKLNYEHEFNFFKLGKEKIGDFVKLQVREIIEMDKDQAKGPFYAQSASVVEGVKYLIAANVEDVWKAATPLPTSGNPFGYFKPADFEGQFVTANDESNAVAFVFKKNALGYTMQDATTGRYYGMDNSHNSFQVNAKYAEATEKMSFDWSVELQADGTVKITNIANKKVMQYDPKYKSFGAYPDARGIQPYLLQYNIAAATRTMPVVGYNASDVYTFDGSAWKEFKQDGVDVQAVDPAIYNTIGKDYIKYPNSVLPEYMMGHNPYAEEKETVAVVYVTEHKVGKDYVKFVEAKQLVFTNGEWVITTHIAQNTDQFVKNSGVWNFDPSVVLDFSGRGDNAKEFFQAATDWVWENIDVPAGCTAKGQGYVTHYGTNEYYAGCSAYKNNVDWRTAKAKDQNPKGYEGMDDDQILAKMQEHFIETMQAVLAMKYGELAPIEGIKVTCTINFAVYDGKSDSQWTVLFEVTAPATFTYVEGSLKKLD